MLRYGLNLKGQTKAKAFNFKRLGKIPREALVIFIIFGLHWFTVQDVHHSPIGLSLLFSIGTGKKGREMEISGMRPSRLWSF